MRTKTKDFYICINQYAKYIKFSEPLINYFILKNYNQISVNYHFDKNAIILESGDSIFKLRTNSTTRRMSIVRFSRTYDIRNVGRYEALLQDIPGLGKKWAIYLDRDINNEN